MLCLQNVHRVALSRSYTKWKLRNDYAMSTVLLGRHRNMSFLHMPSCPYSYCCGPAVHEMRPVASRTAENKDKRVFRVWLKCRDDLLSNKIFEFLYLGPSNT